MGRVVKTIDLGLEGLNVSLYSDSDYWRARIRLKDGKWITKSLKTLSEKEAMVLAVKLHTELSLNESYHKNKFYSFRNLAEEVIKEIESTKKDNKSEMNYVKTIKEFTYEFFNDVDIRTIGDIKIQEYYSWRSDRYKNAPKSSLNKHNVALRKVFKKAIQKEIPIKLDLTKLKNEGIKEKARDLFTIEEIDRIQNYLVDSIKLSKNSVESEKFDMLFDVMEFILCSGVRAGEEYYNIKWGDINISLENGVPVLRFHIRNGKTGERNIIVKTHFISTIKQIAKNFPDRTRDDYLFRYKNGSRPSKESLSRLFTTIVKKLNIRNNQTGVKTLYSLRHSFITWHLVDGIETFSLTKQCGTSVSMLERYYEKVKVEDEKSRLSGINNLNKNKINIYSSTKDASEKYIMNAEKLYKDLVDNCITRGYP